MRNLLIVQDPPLQDPADFLAIKSRIEKLAPDIEVRIINNRRDDPLTARWQAGRPSLVFSPFVLIGYKPPGGRSFPASHTARSSRYVASPPLGCRHRARNNYF
jgi:hypothetical protein